MTAVNHRKTVAVTGALSRLRYALRVAAILNSANPEARVPTRAM